MLERLRKLRVTYVRISLLVLVLIIDVVAVTTTLMTVPGEDTEKINTRPIFDDYHFIGQKGTKYLLGKGKLDPNLELNISEMMIYDITEKRVVHTFSLEDYYFDGVGVVDSDFSDDGTTLAIVYIGPEGEGSPVMVYVINLETSEKRYVTIHDRYECPLNYTYYGLWIRGNRVFLYEEIAPAGGTDGRVLLYEIDLSTMNVLHKNEIREMEEWEELMVQSIYAPIDVSSDGRLFAYTDIYHNLFFYNLEEKKIQAVVELGSLSSMYLVPYMSEFVCGMFDHTGRYFLFVEAEQFITIKERYNLYMADISREKREKMLTIPSYASEDKIFYVRFYDNKSEGEGNVTGAYYFQSIGEEDGDVYYTHIDGNVLVLKDAITSVKKVYFVTISIMLLLASTLLFFSVILAYKKLKEKKGWKHLVAWIIIITPILLMMVWGIYIAILKPSPVVLMRTSTFAILLVWLTLSGMDENRYLRRLMPIIFLGQMVVTNLAFHWLL